MNNNNHLLKSFHDRTRFNATNNNNLMYAPPTMMTSAVNLNTNASTNNTAAASAAIPAAATMAIPTTAQPLLMNHNSSGRNHHHHHHELMTQQPPQPIIINNYILPAANGSSRDTTSFSVVASGDPALATQILRQQQQQQDIMLMNMRRCHHQQLSSLQQQQQEVQTIAASSNGYYDCDDDSSDNSSDDSDDSDDEKEHLTTLTPLETQSSSSSSAAAAVAQQRVTPSKTRNQKALNNNTSSHNSDDESGNSNDQLMKELAQFNNEFHYEMTGNLNSKDAAASVLAGASNNPTHNNPNPMSNKDNNNPQQKQPQKIRKGMKHYNKHSKHFPMILYKLLMENKYDTIISWTVDGKAAMIHDIKQFEQKVSGIYFSHGKIESLYRQLRRYHFCSKRSRNTLFIQHDKFIKGDLDLCVKLCQEKGVKTQHQQAIKRAINTAFYNAHKAPPGNGNSRTTVLERLHGMRTLLVDGRGGNHDNDKIQQQQQGQDLATKAAVVEDRYDNRFQAAFSASVEQANNMAVVPTSYSPSSSLLSSLPPHRLPPRKKMLAASNKLKLDALANIALRREPSSSSSLQQLQPNQQQESCRHHTGSQQEAQEQEPNKQVKTYSEGPEDKDEVAATTGDTLTTATATACTKFEEDLQDCDILPTSWMKYNKHFPMVLYNLLMDNYTVGSSKAKQQKHIIDWSPDGRSVIVHDIRKFETDVMGHYFCHCNIESFQRSLRRYKFSSKRGNRFSYFASTSSSNNNNNMNNLKRAKATTMVIKHDMFVRGEKKLLFDLCQNKKN